MTTKILQSIITFLTEMAETIIFSLIIFLVAYTLLGQPHRVEGDSMLPTFENGELIITDKITYKFRPPKRGEVIVFAAPPNQQKDYIKRIIGLPGETITISNGDVLINNQKLTENYIHESTRISFGSFIKEGETKIIPPNNYFVMGDNRSISFDSREWGFLDKENIIGKAWLIYWPITKFSFVKNAVY